MQQADIGMPADTPDSTAQAVVAALYIAEPQVFCLVENSHAKLQK